jgi:glycosyltransferase involved in cell wall biosynthesis
MQELDFILILVMIFAAIRFIVLLSNVFNFRKLAASDIFPDKSLAVLIPARNEEENIAHILDDLSHQSLDNFEVIVYNDLSEDNTVEVVQDAQKKNASIRLLEGIELPKGWSGKSHACHQLAQHTNADLLVFLDADVRIEKDFLQKVASHSQKNELDLLSIFPVQITSTLGEKIVVPLFNWILLTLLPLGLVRKSTWSSFSAANGQCMVFDGNNYRKNQWHKVVKHIIVEDIGIMKAMKKKKCKVETLIGQKEVSCRMYHTFAESFNGVARSAPAFFSNNLIWAVFYLTVVLIGPIFLIFINIWYFVFYALLVVFIRIFVAFLGKVNALQMVALHLPQMVILPFLVLKGFGMRFRKKYQWKNREFNI